MKKLSYIFLMVGCVAAHSSSDKIKDIKTDSTLENDLYDSSVCYSSCNDEDDIVDWFYSKNRRIALGVHGTDLKIRILDEHINICDKKNSHNYTGINNFSMR